MDFNDKSTSPESMSSKDAQQTIQITTGLETYLEDDQRQHDQTSTTGANSSTIPAPMLTSTTSGSTSRTNDASTSASIIQNQPTATTKPSNHPVKKRRDTGKFDKRLNQLRQFKEEFGHCDVPQKYAKNSSLGAWCNTVRFAHKRIKNGVSTSVKLPPERIQRLEEIGFQWRPGGHDQAFEERCRELIAYKEQFGHCKVPFKHPDSPSLGIWCCTMRTTFKKNQEGIKTSTNLTPDRIKRLEEIGFHFTVVGHDEGFEEKCSALIVFKNKHGHCNVPGKYPDNPALGRWCNTMRAAYSQLKKGIKPAHRISQDRIEKLEDIGFRWKIKNHGENFENRCHELIAFKEKFGHCNVPSKYADNQSFGNWCSTMIYAYSQIQKGLKTDANLTPERILRMEEIGFQWNGRKKRTHSSDGDTS